MTHWVACKPLGIAQCSGDFMRQGNQHGPVRAVFYVSDFLHPHMLAMGRELSQASFIKALIPFLWAPPSCPKHIPKTHFLLLSHLLKLSYLWVRISTYELERWGAGIQTTKALTPTDTLTFPSHLFLFWDPLVLLSGWNFAMSHEHCFYWEASWV